MLQGYIYIHCVLGHRRHKHSALLRTHMASGPAIRSGISLCAHTSRRQRLTNITGVGCMGRAERASCRIHRPSQRGPAR